MRVAVLCILACLGFAAAEPSRVDIPPDLLESLPQEERWALSEAQKLWLKEVWEAAALRYEQFLTRFPASSVAEVVALRQAEALARAERLDGAAVVLDDLLAWKGSAAIAAEAILLLAQVRERAGRIDEALGLYRRVLVDHPASPALAPAVIGADACVELLGQRRGRTPAEVGAERLTVLSVLAARPDLSERNREATFVASRRLIELAIAAREPARILALVRALDAAAKGVRDARREADEIAVVAGRAVLAWAWDRGDSPFAATAAEALWPDEQERWLAVTERRLEWIRATRADPRRVAELRGESPEAILEEAAALLVDLGSDGERRIAAAEPGGRSDLAWVTVRVHLAGDAPGRAVAALRSSRSRPLTRAEAKRLLDLAVREGRSAQDLVDLPEAVAEEERRRTRLDLLGVQARERGPGALQAARAAVGLAAELEVEDARNAADYLEIQADLLRRVIGDHDAAIVCYGKLNRPPATDLAIAETLDEKGDRSGSLAKYLEISAIHAGTSAGARGLLRAGILAHQLDERARSVALLRQVCDDYPRTGEYSEAHRYLQARLGVTYTGGGGTADP